MTTMQMEYITMLGAFTMVFSKRPWEHAKILFMSAILSAAERTVIAVLRVMRLSWEKQVLNLAVWLSLEASRILLRFLFYAFVRRCPIVLGLDATIERRCGAKIKAEEIYRGLVWSSHGHFVKARGLH